MSADKTVPALSPNQINALVVLMAEARELNNTEMKELAGFSLTGDDNKKLEKLDLVVTDRSHRPYSHQLTEEGWWVVRNLHTCPPPKQGGSASRSLFTLLANVDRALERLQVSAGEFFKQVGEVRLVEPIDAESLVRSVYEKLAPAPGEWVGLADLRDELTGVDRGLVDDTLRQMADHNGVRIIPVANSKSLTRRDREASLAIGDEANHMMSIVAS